jgi:3-phosphoshikimate 1-carboxyvinyltransferase
MTPLTARRAGPLRGRIRVPGDKSISHRAVILGALAVGTTRISGLLEGEDVLNTATAMRSLGARVERTGDGAWRVDGVGVAGFGEPKAPLDFGNSGTGCRLVMGAVAGCPISAIFDGDASLRRRPMRRILEPIGLMGARVTRAADGGRLPLTLAGARDPLPIVYRTPVASAQIKSAVLLAGLAAPGTTTVIEAEASRDHTELMLAHFGAEVTSEPDGRHGRKISLTGQPELVPAAVAVPADPSSAAFPLVAALIVPGSDVFLSDVMTNPLRTGLILTLREMGAAIVEEEERRDGGEAMAGLRVRASELRGVEVPAERAPSMIDEYPILAVAAAFAQGTTVMRGLKELRVKESDRLAATADMLRVNGIAAEISGDDLIVLGGGPSGRTHGRGGGNGAGGGRGGGRRGSSSGTGDRGGGSREGRGGGSREGRGGGLVATHMDHRIAMAALVLGLAAERPVMIDDAAMIATSFPGFAQLMRGLGADLGE